MSEVDEVIAEPATPGPALGREVAAPRARLRPQFVVALGFTLAVAVTVLLVRQVRHAPGQAAAVGGWYATARARCNPLEVDVLLRDSAAPPAERAMCLAVAGRITQARAILDAMSGPDRSRTVTAIFHIAHPIADSNDDLSAGPIMGLVVEYQPDNYMAVFHAGMAEFALGHDDRARTHLEHFLGLYAPDDVWRQRAVTALRDITTSRPLDEREAHFPE